VRRLSSLAWPSLRAHPLRSFLTTAGITLGVAVLFASLSAGATMDAAVDRAAADEIGHAVLRVQTLEERGLGPDTVAAIEGVRGVSVAAPALERKTYIAAGLTRTPAGRLPSPVTVLGVDPVAEPKLHDMPLVAGRPLASADDRAALVTQTLASQEGLAVGGSITLSGAASVGPEAFEIVGILAGDGSLPDASGRLVIAPLPATQTLFDTTGVTRVDLGAGVRVTADELMAGLEQGITTEPYLLSRQSDIAESLRAEMADFRSALLLVAAVVLFAGAFLIFNTLSMTVAERWREWGLLRAAGATRSQIVNLVLYQATLLGLGGSVCGVVLGVGLAELMLGWVQSPGPLSLDAPTLSGPAIVLALCIGMVVTLAASLEPAWRAGRIAPAEALRRAPARTGVGAARLRWLVVVFAALAVAALAVWPAPAGGSSASVASGQPGLVGPLAVYGVLMLVVLVVPWVLGPLLRIAGLPFRVFRNEERLARSSLARDRSRTTLTAGGLVVGLAMVVALLMAASDVRTIGTSWLNETIPGSELVSSIRPISIDDPVRDELAATPGVDTVSPIGLFGVPLDGLRQEAAAIVGADYLSDGRLVFVAGDRAGALTAIDAGGAVIVPQSLADQASPPIAVGDTLEFATGPAPAELEVVGIVAHSIPSNAEEALLVGWSDATTLFGVGGADFFAVRYAAGQEATARPVLDGLALQYALQPNDLDRVQGTVGDALDRIFRLLDALALIAVLVAALGMVNTLSMSVLERVREIGVLRATGMTARQVRGMVVVEAGLLGICGSAVGVAVGMLVGALLVAGSSGGFVVFDPPWATIGLVFGFGVLVSITASIYPAGVASRVSLALALQHE
jgi:putative ABC transport system permease protein